MVSCSVKSCNNKGVNSKNKIDGVICHKFPRDLRVKRVWVAKTMNADSWIPTKNSVICSLHLEETYLYLSTKDIP
ncbi:THAP domain-containing protein 6-like [Chrysoperla carnea]|uniref:THAP domain-containing protein 6-like n=1 Tax=Chrysoperla carnea TaxID=189513 RepID=UPI001D081A2E|nr:THAP domain-containing protein 6-like [Chrysoperla carnea]